MSVPKFQYSIEVTGACNLRCRSCPVGNSSAEGRPKGLMEPKLFSAILEKIASETPGETTSVGLYDWGEAILNPSTPDFIGLIRAKGMRALISSNLNQARNLEEVVKAGPALFTISVSGFTQEIYGRTHNGGEVETVKTNMRQLRRLMEAHGRDFEVIVSYHRYRGNDGAEEEGMGALSRELGFSFIPIEAEFYPLEKRIAFIMAEEERGGKPRDPADWLPGDARLSPTDKEFAGLLLTAPSRQSPALQVDERDVADGLLERIRREGPRYGGNIGCYRITDKLSIRLDGSVGICCASYSPEIKVASSFLDIAHAEIQRRRLLHPFCATCMRFGQGTPVPLRLS